MTFQKHYHWVRERNYQVWPNKMTKLLNAIIYIMIPKILNSLTKELSKKSYYHLRYIMSKWCNICLTSSKLVEFDLLVWDKRQKNEELFLHFFAKKKENGKDQLHWCGQIQLWSWKRKKCTAGFKLLFFYSELTASNYVLPYFCTIWSVKNRPRKYLWNDNKL